MKLSKVYDNILREETQIRSIGLLLEQSIEVGDTLKTTLNKMDNRFANQALDFLTSNKIKDDANIKSVDFDKSTGPTFTVTYTDGRGDERTKEMKIQKLLSYLGAELTDIKGYDVEDFMSKLVIANTSNMKIVDGEDIKKFYHCQMYDVAKADDYGGGNGTMGSCMQHARTNGYFEIYIKNPNQVKMVILMNPDNGKIRGRALIWKLDDGDLYMDRVYVTNNEYRKEFENFKEEKGMAKNVGEVTLEHGGEYEFYPYMDNLVYYTPSSGELSYTNHGEEGTLELISTNGGHSDGREYSELYEEHLDEGEAYYVESLGDWVNLELYMVSDNDGNFGYYDEDYPEKSEMLLITHGEYKNTYIKKDEEEAYPLTYDIYGEDAIAHIDDHAQTYGEFDGMYRGVDILHDDSIEITCGTFEGEYAYKKDENLVYVIGLDSDDDPSDEMVGVWDDDSGIELLVDKDRVAVIDKDNNNKYYGHKIFYTNIFELLSVDEQYCGIFVDRVNDTSISGKDLRGVVSICPDSLGTIMNTMSRDRFEDIYNTYSEDLYKAVPGLHDEIEVGGDSDDIITFRNFVEFYLSH